LRTRIIRRSALMKVPSFSRNVEPGRKTRAKPFSHTFVWIGACSGRIFGFADADRRERGYDYWMNPVLITAREPHVG
jgi:hypothetical protein